MVKLSSEVTILIRKMEEEDISSLISLDERISGSYRPDMWKSEINHYLSRSESICLIAEIHNQVVGFMIGTIHSWLFGIENGGWIEILGVDPAHTAKGIGKKLGTTLFDEFRTRGINNVHASVDWKASDLLEFFKTLGMTKSEFITLIKEL
jgi:ribosomal protein S18 acetylase RimI-like enzyme